MTPERDRLRLVLDTNVLVAATRNRAGASNALVDAALLGRFTWLGSVALFLEYEDVLSRPASLSAAGWDRQEAELFLTAAARALEPVAMHYRWRPLSSDPGDEMVLDTAINGRADMLVSFNKADLASISRFGIPLVPPSEALGRLRLDHR